MMDVVFVATGLACFVASVALVAAFERLRKR